MERQTTAWLSALILGLSLGLGTALAFEPQLSGGAIQQALTEGREQVSRRHGFSMQDWVLWDDPDPITIEEGDGQVEAVIVGTPFEQLRYQSYLQAYQGAPLTQQQAAQEARKLGNTITFQIFAHSQGSGDEYRNFLSEFGGARLELQGGRSLRPANVETFGPAQDFYIVPGKRAPILFLGYVAYRFDLSGLAQDQDISDLQGTLSFTAPSGQDYRFEVNLANFR